MLSLLIVFLVGGGLGFGLGRVKDKAKLAAISAEISNLESKIKGLANVAIIDVMSAVTYVKAKL